MKNSGLGHLKKDRIKFYSVLAEKNIYEKSGYHTYLQRNRKH
jgi:hypothetical protein